MADDYAVAIAAARVEDRNEAWHAVLKHCKNEVPQAQWDVTIPLCSDAEIGRMHEWLLDVLQHEPVPDNINAYWFGLVTRIVRAKDGGDDDLIEETALYVSGSDEFDDPDDATGDWACDPAYFPERRYYSLGHLDNLKQKAARSLNEIEEERFSELWDYLIVLSFSAICLSSIFRNNPAKNFVGKAERWAAVGFDEGDFVMLGHWHHEKWVASLEID